MTLFEGTYLCSNQRVTKSVFGHLNVLPVENPEDLIFRGRTKSPKMDHLSVENPGGQPMGERRKVQKQTPKTVACGHTLNLSCAGHFVSILGFRCKRIQLCWKKKPNAGTK